MIVSAIKYVFIVFSIAMILFPITLQLSFAHPVFISSSPKPFQNVPSSPSEVNVFFSEAIELGFSKISVLGPDGNDVTIDEKRQVDGDSSSLGISLEDNLPNGIYTVTTTVLSQVDGHIVDNSFTFGIGTAVEVTEQEKNLFSFGYAESRFPGMVGQIIIVGAILSSAWMVRPLAKLTSSQTMVSELKRDMDRKIIKLVIIGVILIIASAVAMILVQAISIGSSLTEAIATKFGGVWSLRIIFASALAIVTLLAFRRLRKGASELGVKYKLAILGAALATLSTSSLIAHAAAINDSVAVIIDIFHDIAASVWIGGLAFLAFIMVPRVYRIEHDLTRASFISIIIPRFSAIAVVVLGVILLTGPLLLWLIEDNLALTLSSAYGRILILKLSIGLVMIGIGSYHQLVTSRKMSLVVLESNRTLTAHNISNVLDRFSKSIKIEAGLGIALLAAVAVMTNMTLPEGEFPGQFQGDSSAFAEQSIEINQDFSETIYSKFGKIELTISPYATGPNKFEVQFTDSQGIPIDVNSTNMRLTNIDKSIGPINIETKKQSEGVFAADASFGITGRWILIVEGTTHLESGIPNLVGSFNLLVKPLISGLTFSVEQFKTPVESLPLFPIFDSKRDTIWFGDTLPGSSRIWAFNTESKNFTTHNLNGTNLITLTGLDSKNRIWYIDPTLNLLGYYIPENKGGQSFEIHLDGIVSGLAIDGEDNIWMSVVQENKIIKFSPGSEKFEAFNIPTSDSLPIGLSYDKTSNTLWLAESAGKIASIDPSSGNITEYENSVSPLEEPTYILPDPNSLSVFVSDHEGHKIAVYDPVFNIFHDFPIVNEAGLPFGMAIDKYGFLWFAQHTIDKMGIIDPRTGQSNEAIIPTGGSFVQYVTADNVGEIWLAEQRGSAISKITSIPGQSVPSADPSDPNSTQTPSAGELFELPLSLKYSDFLGPFIAVAVFLSVLLYLRNVLQLGRNVTLVNQYLEKRDRLQSGKE